MLSRSLPLLLFVAATHGQTIDHNLARQYFDEAHGICSRDAGQLWGKSLCAPMIFADPRTHTVVANQADAESRLKPQDGVFSGKLPDEIDIANTAIEWAGVHWTMVAWPLPETPIVRARLMAHELFHRLQDDLGLPAANPGNAHLAKLEGRIWLQLEWRALQQALARPEAPAAERRRPIEDALLFRLRRRALFPKADAEERQLELNEGLAEYTGYKLRGTADPATVQTVIARLDSAGSDTAFARSFAYVSGPAYGMLLDLAGRPWRAGLTTKSDFGDLLRAAYGIALPSDLKGAADQRMEIYDGAALRWIETRHEEQRQAALDAYRKRLIEGPVLVLPVVSSFHFGFDPNGVHPLDDNATVYPSLRAGDAWGILEVENGALMVRENNKFARIVVEAPKDGDGKTGEIVGNGWKLTLAEGWVLAKGDRPGDWRAVKRQ